MNVHIFSQLIRPDKTYNVNKLENYLLNLHELYNEITSPEPEISTETALEVQIRSFFIIKHFISESLIKLYSLTATYPQSKALHASLKTA